MRTVIKLAGALLEDDATVRSLARQIAVARARKATKSWSSTAAGACSPPRSSAWASKAISLPVSASPTAKPAMLPSWFSPACLTRRLAAAISAEGQPAIGISAADAKCFHAEPMVHNDVKGSLGFVGYLTGMNAPFLESLWREGLLPVAPCLGLGSDNELYNINADHMAAACAEYLAADRLIYLTDVAGVLDGEKVLAAVTCEDIERLVQSRVVSGGMVLKLEAAKRALEGGVREVRIVGGSSPDSLLLAARVSESSDEALSAIPGTRVLREPLSSAQAALSVA